MNIIFATYIDNQGEINYPINYLVKNTPDMIVYCSDQANKSVLKQQGIEATIIAVKIIEPSDIALAQNKCIDHIFDTVNPDFVVWNQADILITNRGAQYIKEFCVLGNIAQTAALGLIHIKCFHLCGFSYYGVNIIGRNAWPRIKFTGDGAYLGSGAADYCAKDDLSVDIGYLTIEQCRRHLSQHKKTWNSNDNITGFNDSDFVKEMIRRHNQMGLIPETSPYFEIIQDMGLLDEYNKIKALCQI